MAINVRIVSRVKTDIFFPNWLNDLQSVTILQKDLAQ